MCLLLGILQIAKKYSCLELPLLIGTFVPKVQVCLQLCLQLIATHQSSVFVLASCFFLYAEEVVLVNDESVYQLLAALYYSTLPLTLS